MVKNRGYFVSFTLAILEFHGLKTSVTRSQTCVVFSECSQCTQDLVTYATMHEHLPHLLCLFLLHTVEETLLPQHVHSKLPTSVESMSSAV